MVTGGQTIRPITHCRICGREDLRPVIDLGSQYIASIFAGADIPEPLGKRYPLEVVRCASPDGCGLVQLRHSVSPQLLYSHYGYLSGINEAMRINLRDIVQKVASMVTLAPGDVVADIGCNDGTLLSFYHDSRIDRLGFDPAENVTRFAQAKGLEVVQDFFSSEAFRRARPGKKARVITSIAMFYDLEDPGAFAGEVASILADDGVWVIELSYLPCMLAKNSYDTICHEHLEYFSLRQITWMLDRHGLRVHGLEFNEVNGGSFRLFIRKQEAGPVPGATREAIQAVQASEERLGLGTESPYLDFREKVVSLSRDLRSLLEEISSSGKTVYVYGASTKGNTILQCSGIDRTLVPKAVDRNPDKWGRSTLGSGIPIISEAQARLESPDYFLVLPWHFLAVFVERERAFLERGGKFILPLPEVRMIGEEAL